MLQWTKPNDEQWRFLFPGDTGYNADFKLIRQRLGAIDFLALLIGAYLPRDFMKGMHSNPADAVESSGLRMQVKLWACTGAHLC